MQHQQVRKQAVFADLSGNISGNNQELAAHAGCRQTFFKARLHLPVFLFAEQVAGADDMQPAHMPAWAAVKQDCLFQRAPVIVVIADRHQDVAEQAAFRVLSCQWQVRRRLFAPGKQYPRSAGPEPDALSFYLPAAPYPAVPGPDGMPSASCNIDCWSSTHRYKSLRQTREFLAQPKALIISTTGW